MVAEKDRSEEQKALIKKYPSTVVTPGNLYLFDRPASDDLKTYTERQTKLREELKPEEFLRALTEPVPSHRLPMYSPAVTLIVHWILLNPANYLF